MHNYLNEWKLTQVNYLRPLFQKRLPLCTLLSPTHQHPPQTQGEVWVLPPIELTEEVKWQNLNIILLLLNILSNKPITQYTINLILLV